MKALLAVSKIIDSLNRIIGLVVMYGLFVLMAILLWSSISKTFFYVRMDLFYGSWSVRRKATVDTITVFFLVFYLGIMLYGALGSTAYSLGYWGSEPLAFFTGLLTGAEEVGRMERSSTAWRPFIWPIKAIMITGLLLMLLQAFSELCKDIARLRGYDLPGVER